MKAPITAPQAMQHPTVVETINTLSQLADKLRVERDALQAKLDALSKGEPVAYVDHNCEPHKINWEVNPLELEDGTGLYAAPKALAPLTDEQVYFGQWDDGSGSSADFREGARFAERHHGIGGTP